MKYSLLLTIFNIVHLVSADIGHQHLIRRRLDHALNQIGTGDNFPHLIRRSGHGTPLPQPRDKKIPPRYSPRAHQDRQQQQRQRQQQPAGTSRSVVSSQAPSRSSFETDSTAKTAALHYAAKAKRREARRSARQAPARDSIDDLRSASTTTSGIRSPRAVDTAYLQPPNPKPSMTESAVHDRTLFDNIRMQKVATAANTPTSLRGAPLHPDNLPSSPVSPGSAGSAGGPSDIVVTQSPYVAAKTSVSATGPANVMKVDPDGAWTSNVPKGRQHNGQHEHPEMAMTGGRSSSADSTITAAAKGRVVQGLIDTRAGGKATLHMGMDGIPIKGTIGPGLRVPMSEVRPRRADRSLMVAQLQGKGMVKVQANVDGEGIRYK